MKETPFAYGRIVRPPHFTNRVEELARLSALIEGGQSIWVAAPRRLGKSSLVVRALEDLEEPRRALYADCYQVSDLTSLAQVLADALLEALGEPAEALERLAVQVPRLAGASFHRDRDRWRARWDPGHREAEQRASVAQLLAAPDSIATPEVPVVVALDEFQEVLDLKEEQLVKQVRSEVQRSRNTTWIFLGSQHHMMVRSFAHPEAPLYRSCEAFPVGPIGAADLVDYVRERFLSTGLECPDSIAREIVTWCGCLPAQTQELASHLHHIAVARGAVPDSIEEAVETVLDAESAGFSQLWEHLAATQRRVLTSLAIEGPVGAYRAERLREYRLTPSSQRTALRALEERGIVLKDEAEYEVADPIFRAWLERLFWRRVRRVNRREDPTR